MAAGKCVYVHLGGHMDILVSQLNRRLALQLPAELPLGLIFVAGRVVHLQQEERKQGSGNGRHTNTVFDLEQADHRLRCKLSQREAERVLLREGDEVRLGGHLAFDPLRAEYYLLARDAEVTGGPTLEGDPLAIDLDGLVEDQAAFTAALTGIKRRSDIARQTSTALPEWVHKIAPLELQAVETAPAATPEKTAQPPLDEELVRYLSSAMESEQDVELTPEMLAQWLPREGSAPVAAETAVSPETAVDSQPTPVAQTAAAGAPSEVSAEAVVTVRPYDPVGDPLMSPEVPPLPAASSRTSPAVHRTDWLVVVLIITMVVFTCALILIVTLSLLR